MYVQSTEACDMPNSETPMSQSAIDAQNAFIASVGSAFVQGDNALDSLIQQLGGNPAGATTSGNSGVPTTGTLDTDIPGIPVVPNAGNPQALLPDINNPSTWAWAPSPPLVLPGGGAGYRAPQGEQRQGSRRRFTNATPQAPAPQNPCPVVIPLVTAIPIPQTAPPAAVTPTPQAQPVAAPTPAPAAPAAPAAPLPDCRTGNWCIDIRNGCVLSSQVSQQQLEACSEAGYAGNLSMYPQIAAAGGVLGGEYFGTPEPNPPPYTPGMTGLGQDAAAIANANAGVFSSAIESVITAVVTAVALGMMWKGKFKG